MKRWTTETVADTPATLEITGYHENKRSPRTQYRVVIEKAQHEQGSMQIHRGRVVAHEGTTEATAARLASHLAATGQLHPGSWCVL